jgi:hypothetical protein
VPRASFWSELECANLDPVLDLGPRARVVFAALYLSGQAILVLTAERRPDHIFGFRMFSESSDVRIDLEREVASPSGHGTVLVPVVAGAWMAADKDGTRHHFAWHDRVRDPTLGSLGVLVPASYGVAAQIARLTAALDDVMAHTPDDTETRRLVAQITVRRNAHEPTVVRLNSAPR